jgi:UDP-2-acetamido-2,6-beta-L-arabino-hexul-4-ose reductase
MRVLITGSEGFIGKNLAVRLREAGRHEVLSFVRGQDIHTLRHLLAQADAVVHLAGENRPAEVGAFDAVNTGLTEIICKSLTRLNSSIPVLFSSSTQAAIDNPYGRSKLAAERVLQALVRDGGNPVAVYRLPGVFGKWSKPNYNSVVATFCYNLSRGLPIQVSNPDAPLSLVYIDDVISSIVRQLEEGILGYSTVQVEPVYKLSVGELASIVRGFEAARGALFTERVGAGLVRALYATYISYLPVDRFSYPVPQHSDPRGTFVEMIKTADSGQFSFFTAHPGVTRGGHYHHTKTEKFLVIKGEALFKFRNLVTDERVEVRTSGESPQIVDTIPGWVHDITNVGEQEMIVMLWANEVFDRSNPDTVAGRV